MAKENILSIDKKIIENAAKGDIYARSQIKTHLQSWVQASGKDHATIEAQHILIHSIAFMDKKSLDDYSDDLMGFIDKL